MGQFLGRNIIEDAISQLMMRTSDTMSGHPLSKWMVITANYKEFFRTPAIYIAAVWLVYLIYAVLRIKVCHSGEILRVIVPYAIVGLTPLVWYMFATNHSAVYTFFTNKSCVVSVLAIFFGLISLEQAKE